jgi:ribonuclease HI
VPGGRWASGFDPHTTNQRMELTAALEAVRALEGRVDVVSDSLYVVKCFEDRWYEKWLAQGWKNSAKKDVANRDLWEPLISMYLARAGEIEFRWVKGHSEDVMNDLVDKLAVRAGQLQEADAGDGVPSVEPEQLDARIPPGYRVAIIGHRPPELGGYDADLSDLGRRVGEVLAAKREVEPDLVVLSGLGLGAEQLGATTALARGIPFVAVLPYPDPDSVWPAPSRARFRELLDAASRTVILQNKPPASKQQAGAALTRRDAWLARAAHEALAVWDGENPAIGKQVKTFQDRIGEENVWVVAP